MKRRFWLRQDTSQSEDCASIKPLLSLFSDGMASPAEAHRAEHHLAACEDCRRALEWMRVTHRVIAERPATLPPPDLRARVARALAEAEPLPLSIRTVRRSFVLRPALLAAAASLVAGGIVVEHSRLAARHAVVAPATTVASLLHAAAPTVSRTTSHVPAASPQRVSVVPPRRLPPTVGKSLPETHRAVETRVARVPDVSATVPLRTATLATKSSHPQTHAAPSREPSLEAVLPKTVPHGPGVKPPAVLKNTMEATALPRAPLPKKSDDVAAPAPESAMSPAASVEAVQPKPTQVAVVVPPSSPQHEDVLSNVRARLVTFRAGTGDRKLYRDGSAHVQTTAFNSSGNLAPMYPVVYTPGLNDKP